MPDQFCPTAEDLQHLRVGPLAPHIESFAGLISEQGYCPTSGLQKVEFVADLSRWLQRRTITLQEVDERQIDAFFEARRMRVSRRSGKHATMTLLLRHLRQSRAISGPSQPIGNEVDSLRLDYESFLLQQRALAPASVHKYLIVVRRFLCHYFKRRKVRLTKLRAKHISEFVLHDSANRGRRSAQLMATVLRSFLSFLFQHGRISANLSAAVPSVAGWRLSELPRFLEAEQVEKILRSCDRRRKTGKRDYAILLLIARLGLRAGEVANLSLDDINWRAGELQIRGKGARVDRLPLLDDVGNALADYLQKGRPDCATRRVFIQSKAPYVGFSNPPTGISSIVRAAIHRAKIASRHYGAHVLRHSLATTMLAKGASLTEIGQVLRHQLTQTTEIYAKVDLKALKALALPWPGGAQ